MYTPHYWINWTDGRTDIKFACGAEYVPERRGEADKGYANPGKVTCPECLKTEIFKQDQISFEVGYECNWEAFKETHRGR